jgi:hypothetical protein
LIVLAALAGLGSPDWRVRDRCDRYLRWNHDTVLVAARFAFQSEDAEVRERGRRIWRTWFHAEWMTSRRANGVVK